MGTGLPLPPEILAAGEILQDRQNPRRFPPFEADFQKTWASRCQISLDALQQQCHLSDAQDKEP